MTGMTRRRFIPLLKACNSTATAKPDGGRACKIVTDDYIIHFLLENENFLLSKPHHLIPWKELWGYILDHVAGHRFTRKMKSNNSLQRSKRISGQRLIKRSFINTFESRWAPWNICGLVLGFPKTPSWHSAVTNFYCHLHAAILKTTHKTKLKLSQNYLYWNWEFSKWHQVVLQHYSLLR